MSSHTKTVIVIAGPTASGKTSVAIDVAKQVGCEIISGDSRQCYKELKIGVARPTDPQLNEVPHHFIASHSIHEKVTAGTFEQYALEKAAELFTKDDYCILVGGTGLYISAFCEGMDDIPAVAQPIRDEIALGYKQNGIEWLQEQIKNRDPQFYATGEILNPQRMMRALEVTMATGQSILSFRKQKKIERPFNILKIALQQSKEQLHQNINNRVDKMMEEGLEEEVRSLLLYQHLNALQTVGYKEMFQFFNGEISRSEAVETIKKNTRQYAKRQLTWFKKDKHYHWCPPSINEVMKFLS